MDSLVRFWEDVCSCFPYVLLAMAGSAIRWLNKGLSGGVWGLFVSNITAGFIALLCGLSAEFLHLESGGVFFLSGMAGFMGGTWVLERFTPFSMIPPRMAAEAAEEKIAALTRNAEEEKEKM